MPQITIKAKGAKLVRIGLQDLSLEISKIGRATIYATMQAIVKRMKQYPPKRRNQKYIRTGTLGRSWQIVKTDKGYKVSANPVLNGRRYAKYVVGNSQGEEQAWMHVSTDQGKRWNLFRDVSERETKKLPQEIRDHIGHAIKRKGLGK